MRLATFTRRPAISTRRPNNATGHSSQKRANTLLSVNSPGDDRFLPARPISPWTYYASPFVGSSSPSHQLRLVRARVLYQMRAPYRPITGLPLPPIAGPQNCTGYKPPARSGAVRVFRICDTLTSSDIYIIIVFIPRQCRKIRPRNLKYVPINIVMRCERIRI